MAQVEHEITVFKQPQPSAQEFSLTAYAQDLKAKFDVAKVLFESGMIPASFKTPQAVYAVVLMGGEYGFSPMKSLELFDYIQGRCAMRVSGLMALCIKNRGRFQTIKEDDTGTTIKGQRFDSEGKSIWEETITFTIMDAKKAGLIDKDNWKKYPREMCYARAASRLCKRGWADVLGGLAVTEELRDNEAIDITPQPSLLSQLPVSEEIKPTQNPIIITEGQELKAWYYDMGSHERYKNDAEFKDKTQKVFKKLGHEVLPDVWKVAKEFEQLKDFQIMEELVTQQLEDIRKQEEQSN